MVILKCMRNTRLQYTRTGALKYGGYKMKNNYIGPLKSDPLTNEVSRDSGMIMISSKGKRSSEEIYQALVNRLKIIARYKLSDQEADSAVRNLIDFCQEIINYKIKNAKGRKSKI